MTRERAKELLPVIEAWARGETVQFRTDSLSSWTDAVNDPGGGLSWSDSVEYRIKPKPLEVWAVVSNDNSVWSAHTTKRDAEFNLCSRTCPSDWRIVHMREVTEGEQ